MQIPPQNAIYTYNLRNPQALFTPDKKDEHFIVTLRKFQSHCLRILTVNLFCDNICYISVELFYNGIDY